MNSGDGALPVDWKATCSVPIYKGKDERRECATYKGITIMNKLGKIYGRVVISILMKSRKEQVA